MSIKTAAEIKANQANFINKLINSELDRINQIIERHISKQSEQTVAIELDPKVKALVKIKLHSLGYSIRESEYDPREPSGPNYTYISW